MSPPASVTEKWKTGWRPARSSQRALTRTTRCSRPPRWKATGVTWPPRNSARTGTASSRRSMWISGMASGSWQRPRYCTHGHSTREMCTRVGTCVRDAPSPKSGPHFRRKVMKRWLPLLACCALLTPVAHAAAPTLKTTEFGRGPTVVLLHGMGSNRNYWLPTAKKLLGNHRVVMMDLPGHGDSPLPDPFSLDIAGEQIAQALTA